MSEQELRDGLKLAVADEPPLALDLDELVSTAERIARRRRALIAVGVSTAAVAVAAVTVPVVLGIGGAPQELPQATQPPVTSTTPPPTTTPPKKPTLTEAQLRQRGTELRTYLGSQFPKVVPDAKNVNVRSFGGEAEDSFWDGQRYINGMVQFQLSGAQTAVDVYVSHDQTTEACTSGCRELSQADGSKVVIHAESGPAGNNPAMLITSAAHLRLDGTTTRITTYNYDPIGGPKGNYQERVALTDDQLVRLATDPTLHL